ncbi:hypothetical protein POM88_010782 [Heracleum sosnowskyi]|uniref:Uncharacterized protein n=1 Tax=Heracleum sosnowskyi TaxID=360622 RepID=A0AAD8N0N0_9APIA|nr:hypothetical protein POM88_010782 [Heracleum sosnowskyi]
MPNKSLDSYIFHDEISRMQDWPKLYNIINGLSRGLFGYMPPEYVNDGIFSMKSDIYSFGVLVLEIVSRQRNRCFEHPDHSLNLLGHSRSTQLKEIQDDEKSIETNAFDFYDHSELKDLSKQKTYLADVVGIIKHYQPLTDLVNRFGDPNKQVKMIITDGRSSVNVTLWDAFAEKFHAQMNEVVEKPVILIIASSRVGLWNGNSYEIYYYAKLYLQILSL